MKIIASILLLSIFSIGFCDEPKPQRDYIVESPNGMYFMVVYCDESWGSHTVKNQEIRLKYKEAGIYSQDGQLISKIQNHMWGGIVTNHGIGFGLGQWALLDEKDETSFFICKNNKMIGIKANEIISNFDNVPKSVSHYESIFSMNYIDERNYVIIVTYEQKALIYDHETGEVANIKNTRRYK